MFMNLCSIASLAAWNKEFCSYLPKKGIQLSGNRWVCLPRVSNCRISRTRSRGFGQLMALTRRHLRTRFSSWEVHPQTWRSSSGKLQYRQSRSSRLGCVFQDRCLTADKLAKRGWQHKWSAAITLVCWFIWTVRIFDGVACSAARVMCESEEELSEWGSARISGALLLSHIHP